MMGSLSDHEDEEFFDAQEAITPVLHCGDLSEFGCMVDNCELSSFDSQFLRYGLLSVEERRTKFLNSMAMNFDSDLNGGEFEDEVDRMVKNSVSELKTLICEDDLPLSHCSTSRWSGDVSNVSKELDSIFSRTGNTENGSKCNVDDDSSKYGNQREPQGKCSGQLVAYEELDSTLGSSSSFQLFPRSEIKIKRTASGTMNGFKKKWLRRLRSMTCVSDDQTVADNLRPSGSISTSEARFQRVKVRQCKKGTKELSALFTGQDIHAHVGSILAMKFSPDGHYLASAGEDRTVRVWQVVEDERLSGTDIPNIDSSCVYLEVNHLSELAPLTMEKEKMGAMRDLRKRADSACVIFPQKVFRILEEPLHQFYGHKGDILDLSWSTKNSLLSSSVDKTVRLWQVGCNHCLEVFLHSNYVSCIQFNPVDDNYFISGSIDGKVRVWAINGCRVDSWIDIRDMVTAVCYRPDGQGGIIGSMTGSCYFYNLSDNYIQLEEGHLSLHSKKKSPCRRITGLEFFPQDPSKVMVSSADSVVRILHGVDVIGKYRGPRVGGDHNLASFSPDGKHIVSACEDSNVYLWKCTSPEDSRPSQPKLFRSFEHFSTNASVAKAWSGLRFRNSENVRQHSQTTPFSSPICFSGGQEFTMLESFPKGSSATWPEEKLSATPSPICKSQYKFLKSSWQSTSTSHAWGLVIVTATWDGRIRSFHNYGLPVTNR